MTDLWSKKKKVLTRKERFRITDDLTRRKDKEENIEKLFSQKEELIERLKWEEKIKYEKADKEQIIRRWRLKSICDKFRDFYNAMVEQQIHLRDTHTISKHPEIESNLTRIVPWINERLSLWHEQNLISSNANLRKEIEDCFCMLNTLTTSIENPLRIKNIHLWYECRSDLRDELHRKFDKLSYNIIKKIERHMSYLTADTMYHKIWSEKNFLHTLWTVPHKPYANKDDKFPLQCNFEECGVTISLAKSFQHKPIVVRSLIVFDDYYSGDCRTYPEPESPETTTGHFDEYHNRIWQCKEERKRRLVEDEKDLRSEWVRRLSIINKIKHLIPAPSLDQLSIEDGAEINTNFGDVSNSEQGTTEEPLKDLEYLTKVINLKRAYAQAAIDGERTEIENNRHRYTMELSKYECNMRKYYIVGGVYHLNLLKQPNQPKILKDGAVLRLIEGKDQLQMWPYLETYEPPNIKTTGTLKHSTDDDDEEAENTPEGALLSKLILVVIKLPDHVLWFDAPIPVHWNMCKNYWSNEYIYDTKFNEEKQTLSFRAGIMTAFGLAVFRYNQFPFQSWELKVNPCDSSEVHFNLTTSSLILEFRIRENQICLVTLENANTTALQELVDVFFEPMVLVHLLKNGGVNIFPGNDGCLYVDGVQLKHRVTEDHIYHSMALLCSHYQFSSCRWNIMAGYKKFVFQASEIGSEKGNQLLVVTDERTFVTESSDVTQALNECEGMEMTFYPDLISFAEDCSVKNVKQILETTNPIFVETVYFMLSQTRILGLS